LDTLGFVPRGVARTTLAALAIAAAVAGGTARADVQPTVRGPAVVTPGRAVVFQARGFHAGSVLNLIVSPAEKASCCAVRIAGTFFASESGGAALRFTMPLRYVACSVDALARTHCKKMPWKRGQRATLTVFGYLETATTTMRVVVS
jgi:hypothetical protein